MHIQVETFADIIDEVQELAHMHWEDLAMDRDQIPLELDLETYHRLESLGMLFVVTVRDHDSVIVGYYIGYINNALHYLSCLTCATDLFYLHPKWRRMGVGSDMFSFIEDELRKRGVKRWACALKMHKPADQFMKMHGFKPIETNYTKLL